MPTSPTPFSTTRTPAPVAVVTGAGSGIGRAVALRLAAQGWRLALCGRREARLRETAAAAHAAHALHSPGSSVSPDSPISPDSPGSMDAPATDALVLADDLGQEGSAERIARAAVDRWHRVDALVNVAGMAAQRPIEATTRASLHETFGVNTFGPALLIAALWPRLCASHGVVINVSSLASSDPFDGFFVYAASKAALESLNRSVAREGARFGVRAFNIAPGIIETEMLRGLFDESIVPRDRALPPDAVAAVVLDCIQGRRDADVGTTIAVQR